MIRVSIIEDDFHIRANIAEFLQMQKEIVINETYPCVDDFLVSNMPPPDVLLLDIELPGINGLEGAFLIKSRYPDISILMLTIYEDKEIIFKALQAGATGFLLKNTPLSRILSAVVEAVEGGVPMSPVIAKKVIAYFAAKPMTYSEAADERLTRRELEVANLLMIGDTYKQIAYKLFISPDTARQHVKNIYRKLQINSRVQLINELRKKNIDV